MKKWCIFLTALIMGSSCLFAQKAGDYSGRPGNYSGKPGDYSGTSRGQPRLPTPPKPPQQQRYDQTIFDPWGPGGDEKPPFDNRGTLTFGGKRFDIRFGNDVWQINPKDYDAFAAVISKAKDGKGTKLSIKLPYGGSVTGSITPNLWSWLCGGCIPIFPCPCSGGEDVWCNPAMMNQVASQYNGMSVEIRMPNKQKVEGWMENGKVMIDEQTLDQMFNSSKNGKGDFTFILPENITVVVPAKALGFYHEQCMLTMLCGPWPWGRFPPPWWPLLF